MGWWVEINFNMSIKRRPNDRRLANLQDDRQKDNSRVRRVNHESQTERTTVLDSADNVNAISIQKPSGLLDQSKKKVSQALNCLWKRVGEATLKEGAKLLVKAFFRYVLLPMLITLSMWLAARYISTETVIEIEQRPAQLAGLFFVFMAMLYFFCLAVDSSSETRKLDCQSSCR